MSNDPRVYEWILLIMLLWNSVMLLLLSRRVKHLEEVDHE